LRRKKVVRKMKEKPVRGERQRKRKEKCQKGLGITNKTLHVKGISQSYLIKNHPKRDYNIKKGERRKGGGEKLLRRGIGNGWGGHERLRGELGHLWSRGALKGRSGTK